MLCHVYISVISVCWLSAININSVCYAMFLYISYCHYYELKYILEALTTYVTKLYTHYPTTHNRHIHISPCHTPNSYHIQPSPHHIQYSQCQYSQHPYSQYSHTATQPIQPYRQYSQPRKYTHLPITMDHNTMADKTLLLSWWASLKMPRPSPQYSFSKPII